MAGRRHEDGNVSDTTNVLIMLTVPAHWPDLSKVEITRKLEANTHIFPFLAAEIKRWGNREEIDVEGLQALVDNLKEGA